MQPVLPANPGTTTVGALRLAPWAALASMLLAGCVALAPRDDRLPQDVAALVEPLVAGNRFSGAVTLMRDDRVVYARGFGLASHDPPRPFTPQTPSDGGSLAKTFTAAGLWWLVHEGRLDIDRPVRSLVPEYPHDGVTVRHLITHSSGLALEYDVFDRFFAPGQPRTTEALLRIAGSLQATPGFAPGTRFQYSDTGYDAAALVIERVTGQRYADFVRQRFFLPHGLRHAFARPAHFAEWPVERTRGYRFADGRWQDHDAYDDEAFLGASNLIFSAQDLARWGSAWAQARVLPPAAERAGREIPLIGGKPSALDGLSWYCAAGRQRCHYTGSLNGFHALSYWDRERRQSVGLVTNATVSPCTLVALQRGLIDLLAGRPAAAPAPALPATASRPDRAALAGRYHAPSLGEVRLLWDGQALQLQHDDGPPLAVHAVAGGDHYVPGNDWCLSFGPGAGGDARPAVVHVRAMYIEATAERQPD